MSKRRGPVLLGGYAAKQCARRTHNDWDPTIPEEPWEPSPELQALFDGGIAFEEDVRTRLVAILKKRVVDLDDVESKRERIARTVEAMSGGVEVILGGQLPDDVAGARTGKPDVLVRLSATGERPAYAPGDIKGHRTVKPVANRSLNYSTPRRPASIKQAPGYAEEVAGCFGDFIQLAHYSRMLDSAGFGPDGDSRVGFIIGTDALVDLDESGLVLVWHDLNEPLFKTFSRSQGTRKRSALERYDHEHDFRVAVAQVARQRTGSDADPAPLVVPIGQAECESCPWQAYCAEALGEDAASLAIQTGRLDVREWLALERLGVTTTEELASVDVTDHAWTASYLPEVAHQGAKALPRLEQAVIRAGMIAAGEELRRTTDGPLEIPAADVEIDVDIEWDAAGLVYLWGARRRHGQDEDTASYVPFVSWEILDEVDEERLARQFLDWLRAEIETAANAGQSLLVFHYSSPETTNLIRLVGKDECADALSHFVDLLGIMRQNFIGAHGLSIKKTAPAMGFAWRDEDPGGLQSQLWLQTARDGEGEEAEQARARVLAYNEDDVAATAALRDGLRSWFES